LITLNERIKELRKRSGLSQKGLAEKIGISQRSVSWGEQPGNNVPDSTIKTICMAFNVNEDWVRYGTEPMYIQPDTFSLDNFIKEKGGTELEKEIVKTYFELDPEIRKAVMDHFKAKFASFASTETAASIEPSIEDMEAAYKKSVLNSAQKTASSALNITEGTERQKKSG
jgi:transcriptional regulator with XRE-family HTH domain